MKLDINQKVFFELLKAGLLGKEVRLSNYKSIDFTEVEKLAQAQSVIGLVAEGLEKVKDIKIPQSVALTMAGEVLQLEQRNRAMNDFVANLIVKLREAGVYTLLVKGQGIARCYERPLWRACGDVDLFLSDDNYRKAEALLPSLASSIDENRPETKHLAMTIDGWVVELHGTLRSQLGKRIDSVVDEVQDDTFRYGNVRVWDKDGVAIYLPAPNNDIVFVFCHILQHFFRGGIGLRQICDWCRLMWTYKDVINVSLLEDRLKRMGLVREWKTFVALAVDWLGMPNNALPLYSSSKRWSRMAKRVLEFVLETGNFGQNRDYSYYEKYPFVIYKMISLWKHSQDSLRHFFMFPEVSMREWWRMISYGFKVAAKGK